MVDWREGVFVGKLEGGQNPSVCPGMAHLNEDRKGSFDVFSVAHSYTSDVFLFALTIEFRHGVSGCGTSVVVDSLSL